MRSPRRHFDWNSLHRMLIEACKNVREDRGICDHDSAGGRSVREALRESRCQNCPHQFFRIPTVHQKTTLTQIIAYSATHASIMQNTKRINMKRNACLIEVLCVFFCTESCLHAYSFHLQSYLLLLLQLTHKLFF